MNEKILIVTVAYLAKKPNLDEEDLKNEKNAWKRLVEAGIKEENEIPKRARERAGFKGKSISDSKGSAESKARVSNVIGRKTAERKNSTKKAANPK